MSHQIYYGAIEDDLFHLEIIAHASRAKAEYYRTIYSTDKSHPEFLSEFEHELSTNKGFLEFFVSDYLIKCSTRTRIIQDSNIFQTEDPDYSPDKEAYEAYRETAKCIKGNVKLSIRECCNKIIHAKEVVLCYDQFDDGIGEYWNGFCRLSGDHQGRDWLIEIDIKKWVLAMKHYLDIIKEL
ncbi:hypothetical protein ACEUDQ_15370 [Aeromonas caviae]|uniref:hypothetical protein n=1 Tax=Aeromonas caviae TaxID=648 RepID=UPI0038D05F0D